MEASHKEIRKLRKKLRQIHNLLALTRSLNDEEEAKVSYLDEIQAKLNALLSKQTKVSASTKHPSNIEFSPAEREDPVLPGNLTEEEEEEEEDEAEEEEEEEEEDEAEEEESEKEEVEEKTEEEAGPSPCKVPRTVESDGDKTSVETVHAKPKQSTPKPQAQPKPQPQAQPKPQSKPQKTSKPEEAQERAGKSVSRQVAWWRKKPRYFVQELVGHSDIILDVSVSDGLVCSSSRDTLVKVWSDSGLLECTLSGHTEAVHAVVLLPQAVTSDLRDPLSLPAGARLVVSGGGDSYLVLWRVDSSLRTGTELRRIYTFTPITCLVHVPECGPLVVAAGTSSGKIELWDVLEKSQALARTVHRSAVSSIRLVPSYPPRLLTCSEAGEIGLHALDLAPIFLWGDSPQRQPIRGAAAVVAVDAGADWLLVGDGGSSLKVLQRGFKGVRKVPNSKHEFGVCDGLWAVREEKGSVVFATAFDVDSGRGFLNVFNFTCPEKPFYLCSLQPGQFAGRYLCVDAVASRGDFPDTLVTGGVELLLWQRVTENGEFSAAEVSAGKMWTLYRSPDDEWSGGESGASSDEWTDEEEEKEEEAAKWRWWCQLL